MGSSTNDSKLFITVTLENIQQVLGPLRQTAFYIITAESGYCPACHSDLSSANITAPNSLLGHLRRSKKCIAKREERRVALFGLKQPDSLLWGSVDDLTALDARRYPDRDLWVNQVFPPTRPQQQAPVVTSMSQWHARNGSETEFYTASSPSPSSSSSDDGYNSSSGWSSGSGSPTSAHFHQQYVNGDEYLYGSRRESNATISGKAYYAAQGKPQPVPQFAMPAAYPPVQYGTGLGMGIGAQYRAQQQAVPAPQPHPAYAQQMYGQPMPQMGYAPAPGYMPQQQWQGY